MAIQAIMGIQRAGSIISNPASRKLAQELVQLGLKQGATKGTAIPTILSKVKDITQLTTKVLPKQGIPLSQVAPTIRQLKLSPQFLDITRKGGASAQATTNKLSLEKQFVKELGNVGKGIGNLTKELGITSKKEIPNVLKFTSQLGKVLDNAPAAIKGGLKTLGVIATGMGVSDLYAAFKDNENNLIPTNLEQTSNPVLRLFYGIQGYLDNDNLSKAARTVLLDQDDLELEAQERAFESTSYPGIADELGFEYGQGVSGEKYHIINDKIYAYSTGKPVIISQAVQDMSDGYASRAQQIEQQMALNEQKINQLMNNPELGIEHPEQTRVELIQQQDSLQQELNNINNNPLIQQKYDPRQNLREQYNQRQQSQFMPQGGFVTGGAASVSYDEIFNQVAESEYQNLKSLPQSKDEMNFAYREYTRDVSKGIVPYMSQKEFERNFDFARMKQVAPLIKQKADTIYTRQLEATKAQNTSDKTVAETSAIYHGIYDKDRTFNQGQYEFERNSLTKEHEANTSRMNAETQAQKATTDNKQFQNMNSLGSYLMNAQAAGALSAPQAKEINDKFLRNEFGQ